jgi:ABC-2 type transport system permease protein
MLDRILAISWLRWRMAIHAMRSGEALLHLAGSVLITLTGVVFSIGMAIGFGAMAYFAIGSNDADFLKITWVLVLFSCAFFGIFMPLLFAASGHGFDLRRLLIFPLSRGQLYGISLGSAFLGGEHLFYFPSLVAVSFMGFVLPGKSVIGGLALVFTFTCVVVVWSHAIMMLLQGLMRRRRSRELVVSLIFLVIVLGSLTPVLMTHDPDDPSREIDGLLDEAHGLARVAELLPPFIAASGLAKLYKGASAGGWISLAWLLLWLASALAAGWLVFTRQILGEQGSRSNASARTNGGGVAPVPREDGFDATDLPFFSQQVIGVAVKELHYLLRSVVGRFNLVVTPVFALIIVFVVTRGLPTETLLGIDPETLALFGMLGYMTLFSNNFTNNAFAWEGPGIQFYFCGPLALEKVLMGKNLGVWIFTWATGLLAVLIWSAFRGVPDVLTLTSSLLMFACCTVAFTTVGNFNSILFPVARDCSSITNSPSSLAVLVGLGTLAIAVGAIGAVVVAPVALGYPAFQPLIVAMLLGLLLLVYRFSLPRAAALMAYRAEKMVDKLRV